MPLRPTTLGLHGTGCAPFRVDAMQAGGTIWLPTLGNLGTHLVALRVRNPRAARNGLSPFTSSFSQILRG